MCKWLPSAHATVSKSDKSANSEKSVHDHFIYFRMLGPILRMKLQSAKEVMQLIKYICSILTKNRLNNLLDAIFLQEVL